MSHNPKHPSKEQWRALINEQQSSALNQSDFCRSKGLNSTTFSNWKRRLNGHVDSVGSAIEDQWIELPVASQPPSPPSWDIELQLPGNVVLRLRR